MQRFVHNENVSRFVSLLETETDSSRRAQLQELLVEEEDRFGTETERLQQADLLVRRGEERVRQQSLLLQQLAKDGAETGLAQRVLDNMVHLLGLFADYRQGLVDGVERSHPSRLV